MLIDAHQLSRTYRLRVSRPDRGCLRSLLRPHHELREALRGVTFSVGTGEIVGYIGANRAGKSTTFKIIAGILAPSAGWVQVDGLDPLRHRRRLSWSLGYLAGQKGNLWWDLPTRDSFDLVRRIYRIPEKDYRRRLEHLVCLLDLGSELGVPVRQLSLGTRTRAEIAATFLHAPRLVLLDEPTIGLDLLAKARVYEFLRTVRRESGVTVLLATHDMQDVEAICDRVILIDRGTLIFDGTADDLSHRYGARRRLRVEMSRHDAVFELPPEFELVDAEGSVREYLFDPNAVSGLAHLSKLGAIDGAVRDVTIEAVDLSSVVRGVYAACR